jgi:RecA-family ATPase
MKTATNLQAEKSVLCAIFQGSLDPAPAFRSLRPKDFFHRLHARIFACASSLHEQGEPLSIGAVQDRMKLDPADTIELAGLIDPLLAIRTPADLAANIGLVRRARVLRDLKKSCDAVVEANGDAVGQILNLRMKLECYDALLRQTIDAPGVLASTIRPEVVDWFWPKRIPLGKITIEDGDPDQGKSLLSIDLAARCTSGRSMPDDVAGATGGAVLLNCEDDSADTIVPRLLAAGANLERVRILKTIGQGNNERQIEIPLDIPAIREAALDVGATLIVIDPLMGFLTDKANSWRDQDVRRALAPLAALAAELHVAILVIRHLNKSTEGNPLYRGGGSIGIIGAARAGLVVGGDPDDESGEPKILAVSKSNLSRKAPSLRYRLDPHGTTVIVRWLGESEHRASTILAAEEGQEKSKTEECRRFIVGALENGARPAKDVIREAKAAGFSERTLDRAKIRAKVETYRAGFGKGGEWMWNIPEGV